jgi:hypothetical protein
MDSANTVDFGPTSSRPGQGFMPKMPPHKIHSMLAVSLILYFRVSETPKAVMVIKYIYQYGYMCGAKKNE